jgi:hypothetical protein
MDRRIKDSLLEKYAAGALAGEAKAELERTLAESEPDRQRLAELEADSRAFLAAHPPGPLVAKYEARLEAARPWWRRPMASVAPALAAVGALVLVVVLLPRGGGPELIAKGGLAFSVHVKRGESSVRVESTDVVHPGDAIRFEVRTDRPGYVAVLGFDSRRVVTIYYPYAGSAAMPLNNQEPLLPTAIELDQELGRETLYALFSERPFQLDWAVEALRAEKLEQALPGDVSLARVELEKR